MGYDCGINLRILNIFHKEYLSKTAKVDIFFGPTKFGILHDTKKIWSLSLSRADTQRLHVAIQGCSPKNVAKSVKIFQKVVESFTPNPCG